MTYELWYAVRVWAVDQGYIFVNEGFEGSREGRAEAPPTKNRNEPATLMSVADIIVWCNALAELTGYEPVYMYKGTVIRDANDALARDNAVQAERNGFRMPTSDEWELAARYNGNASFSGGIEYPRGSGIYWTPGNHASGAIESYANAVELNEVAWYNQNSGGTTHQVGLKRPNSLGLFDMSGNVSEYCFAQNGPYGISRGGSWGSFAE